MPTDVTKPQPQQAAQLEKTGSQSGQTIVHGFFNRVGGISEGIYAGLNVGTGSNDNQDHVAENRRLVADFLGVKPENLITVHQIHSPDVVKVTEPLSSPKPQADAMVTNVPGLALGALTADCGPVLFADHQAGIIGAAHAGWRGALGGVLENTIAAMIELGASRENIVAVLGPTIGPENYEVGTEFYQKFLQQNKDFAKYFTPSVKQDHYMFNLWRFITDRLEKAGVQATALEECTYADQKRFFSYRRTTHRAEPDYGRQIAAIAIRE
ncbi:peptidoglycan editing factor PgeF [Paenochrobactrum sp. BZR 588]|uniref:peptidoglycan editing factor PgeF n=1 Tax=Paenochrobactrum TaxID=999488 RepID=UPI0035BBAC54